MPGTFRILLIASLALLSPATVQSSPTPLERCLAAHRAMKAGAATIEVAQTLQGRRTTMTYRLAYVRPHQASVQVVEPAQQDRAASNRTFALVGDRFFAYDAVTHEQLSRKAIPVGTMIQKLTTQMGPLDESAAGILEPDRLAAFLRPFRAEKGWKTSRSGAFTVLTKATGTDRAKATEWRFETTTMRLRGLRIDIPGGRLEWKIGYGSAPKSISWRPPKDAAMVSSFTLRPGPPRYASSEARAIAEKSIRAYDRLQHVHYWSESEDGVLKVWLSGGKLRQESRSVAFVHSSGQATVLDHKNRRAFTGKAGSTTLLNALAKLGVRIDPIIRQVMTRQNPVRMLLLPGTTVNRIGNVTISGVPGDILEFQTPSSRIALTVRQTDGLLSLLRSEIRDPQGNRISGSERSFVYGPIGKPLPPETFKLAVPSGYRKLAIAEIAR